MPDSPSPAPALPAGPSLQTPSLGALRTILALIIREMGTTYGRSPGGYVWAVMESVGIVAIMAIVFSFMVRTPSLGTSFLLFYATGWLSFGYYDTIEGKTRRSLRSVSALMSYPRVTWLDAVFSRTILATLTEVTSMIIIFGGIVAFTKVHVTLDLLPILNALAIAWLLGIGVGMIAGLLSALSQLFALFWRVLTRPLMIASGIFFIYEDLPALARDVLWWNPLFHVTALFRAGFYGTYDADFVSLPYCFGVALVLILFGLIFMRSYYQMVLER